jgi:hypothetical protein
MLVYAGFLIYGILKIRGWFQAICYDEEKDLVTQKCTKNRKSDKKMAL